MASQLTIEELKKIENITNGQLDEKIEQEDLAKLGGFFDKIDDYLPEFGLQPAQQGDVRDEVHQKGIQAGMRMALQYWRALNPYHATYRALLDIVLSLRHGNVAVKICEYLKGILCR